MSLSVRPLTSADLGSVVRLTHAYDSRWFGEPLLTAEDIASTWSDPDLVLERDSEGWVDEDDQLQAYATLDPGGVIELAVAQGWEGAGLEDALMRGWEADARRRGHASVQRFVADADHAGREALLARGYALGHTTWILRLDPGTPITGRTLPPGYAVRPAAEADAVDIHRVVEDAFTEWRTWRRPYAGWRALNWDRPDLVPAHARVVTTAGELVGACLVLEPAAGAEPREAWVPQLAVAREHRHRGLAQQLLASVSEAARARGVLYLGLATDTRTGALDLYQRLGMTVRHTLHSYALDLRADSPGTAPTG